MKKINRALISVSDKAGLPELVKPLTDSGVEIYSTGGTFRLLTEKKIPVKRLDDLIDFPEILDGRVKTLNPRVHGGILARRDMPSHMEELEKLGILPFDLIVVNLYPFEKITAKKETSFEEAIENIDIGGVTLLRAAAKNQKDVTILSSPADYTPFLTEWTKEKGSVSQAFRAQMGLKAFQRTAEYDISISSYLSALSSKETYPEKRYIKLCKKQDLRYGENPHQTAGFYGTGDDHLLTSIKQLHGKELSFNNIIDLNACFELTHDLGAHFTRPGIVIIKHTNPCGAALGDTSEQAYQRALQGDPVSAYGSIVGSTKPLDAPTAKAMSSLFVEIILAPSYEEEALNILKEKKNLRIIECPDLLDPEALKKDTVDVKKIRGGYLIQDSDDLLWKDLATVAGPEPSKTAMEEITFTWIICSHVKSNAIVYTKDFQILGTGAGQMSRVDSARIGLWRARQHGLDVQNCIMGSDAFFPFRDSIDAAAEAGVKTVIQPGGSKRDEEVIQAAKEKGLTMILTGTRHFRH